MTCRHLGWDAQSLLSAKATCSDIKVSLLSAGVGAGARTSHVPKLGAASLPRSARGQEEKDREAFERRLLRHSLGKPPVR